ncbi:MAG: foldase protein PrsA [Actinomycetota bacterium]
MPRRAPSLTLAVAAALLLSGCGLFRAGAATVNGRAISEDRFVHELDFLLADPAFAEQLASEEGEGRRQEFTREFLTFLIHQELVQEYAESHDITISQEDFQARFDQLVEQLGGREAFDRQVRSSGVEEADVLDLVRQQLLREQVAESVIEERLTEERLRQMYEERIGDFTLVHVAHILVPDAAEAERIARQATPRNFERLARQFSQDTGSAAAGGDLGEQRPADLVGPFAQAMLDIPVGEIGGPVQTEFGFHVIHVIDRRTRSFDEVAPQLLEEARGETFREWLLEQVARAEIRVNPRYGLFDEQAGVVVPRTATTPSPPPVQVVP